MSRIVRIIVYKDRAGKWRWRIRSCNGRTLADSGQGYTRRGDCWSALLLVMRAGGGGTWRMEN